MKHKAASLAKVPFPGVSALTNPLRPPYGWVHRKKQLRRLRSRSINIIATSYFCQIPGICVVQHTRRNEFMLNGAATRKLWRSFGSHQIDVTMDHFHWRSDDIRTAHYVRCRNVIGPPVETALQSCSGCLSPNTFRHRVSRSLEDR